MLQAVTFLAVLSGLLACLLVVSAARLRADPDRPLDDIEALLPRIQCGQCGYPGCRPYAAAMLAGQAPPTLCPPGGQHTVERLAERLGLSADALDESDHPTRPVVARIDEAVCIGCALCLPACPFDAIVGAHRHMHTVVASACTGCGLCVPPCPVDCIDMVDIDTRQTGRALT